ncbi:hypothetical protein NEIG_02299 [Nematocida sp. ERTm5]|nr:hypothetical protein NEIG_02299 [Nematocida sp. ERTm5]
MSDREYTDSEEYSNSEYFTGDENYDSQDASDQMASSGNMPELFTVQTGPCEGDYDRIDLLIRQAKMLSPSISEKQKEALFAHIVARSEAEGIETDPWITSFFSVLKYPEAKAMLLPKVDAAIRKLPEYEEMDILISARFANVPEEIMYEMYEAFPAACMHSKDQKILLLSLERPVQKEEETEIKRVFPKFKFTNSGKLFPIHTEEIFLILNNEKPAFSCSAMDDITIKGYILNKERIIAFIEAMKVYYA